MARYADYQFPNRTGRSRPVASVRMIHNVTSSVRSKSLRGHPTFFARASRCWIELSFSCLRACCRTARSFIDGRDVYERAVDTMHGVSLGPSGRG